jgi:preprotein translocase subunit SecE
MGRTALSSIMKRMTGFLKEVRIESTKVTWPSRKELRESTIVVVIAVTVIAVFIGAADRILSYLLSFVVQGR